MSVIVVGVPDAQLVELAPAILWPPLLCWAPVPVLPSLDGEPPSPSDSPGVPPADVAWEFPVLPQPQTQAKQTMNWIKDILVIRQIHPLGQ